MIILLWVIIFFDSYQPEVWKNGLLATIFVGFLSISFKIGYRHFSKSKPSRWDWLQLTLAAGLFAIIMIVSESILIEDYDDYHQKDIPAHLALLFSAVFSFMSVAISIIVSWALALFEKNKQNELALSKLKGLNKESELTHLKNQLNPHFLFNALSNIYSISYLGDKETPEKIMQLSKMLRYVIYDSDVPFIRLNKEIDYLKDYIDFQKFKIKEEQQIDFDYEHCDTEVKIAPLILLPFVENSFKHSQIGTVKDAWVKIELKTDNRHIRFLVENTISSEIQPEILNNAGIGLGNIKKRLSLIYKSNYNLNISGDSIFRVDLEIKNNE